MLKGRVSEVIAAAGDNIRRAAEGTGKLVLAALAVAGAALVVALAALLAVMKLRKAVA